MSLSNTGPSTSTPSSADPVKEKGGGDTRLTSPPSHSQSSKDSEQSHSGKNLACLSIFLTLEAGYFVLAAICLARDITLPILLNLNLSDTVVKGGFTVIFVIWQKSAIFLGTYFVLDVFSREWWVQLEHTAPEMTSIEDLVGKVDSVSTITSGFFAQISYLLFHYHTASGTFKLAVLASLSFVLLSSLASGTIVAATALIDTSFMIQIGRLPRNFTSISGSRVPEAFTAETRADLILRLEKIEKSPFGFKLPDNMLTAVPMVNLSSFKGTIEYQSDVIEFHHDCHWEAPQFSNTSDGTIVTTAGGQQWIGATVGNKSTTIGSSVGPLYLGGLEQVGISAFIFSGGNSSISVPHSNPPMPFAIDLGSLPVTHTPSGAGFDLDRLSVYAPLSAILVCDPQTKITGGYIRLTDDRNLTIVSSENAPIGNIPQSAANLLFTNAFSSVLLPFDLLAITNLVGDVASNMFMSNVSADNWDEARNIRPLDLPSINKNMDAYMLSAAKAYIDGHNERIGTGTVVNFNSETVPAKGKEAAFVLSTSKWFFIPTVVLIVISTVSVLAIAMSSDLQRRPFDLKNVYGELNQRGGRVESFTPRNT